MPSLPAGSSAPSTSVPSPTLAPSGTIKVKGHEDAPTASRATPTSSMSGPSHTTSNNNSRVDNSVSTNSLSDVSATLDALGFSVPAKSATSLLRTPKKKVAVSVDACSPPPAPLSAPPSPDDATPSPSKPASSSASPGRPKSPPPLRFQRLTNAARKRLFEDDEDRLRAATTLAALFITNDKTIVNADSTAIPIIPNGATADAAKSNFRVTAPTVKYSVVLEGVGSITVDHFLRYFKLNGGPHLPVTDSISIHSGTAVIKYDSREEWDLAIKHKWSVGKVWLPKNFDPTVDYDVFYRVCFSGADFNIDNLFPRVKAYFATYDVDITHAQVTNNPGIMMAYIRGESNWARYEDLRYEKRFFSLPPFGRDQHPTVFSPIPALTTTNNTSISRMFVGKVPIGADESLIRERVRIAATEGGFNPEDVITFGAYRYPGSTKTSRYGYLHVRGLELATYLTKAVIDTAEGTLEVAFSEEKPKSKKARNN